MDETATKIFNHLPVVRYHFVQSTDIKNCLATKIPAGAFFGVLIRTDFTRFLLIHKLQQHFFQRNDFLGLLYFQLFKLAK
jgi:hypothetical protein